MLVTICKKMIQKILQENFIILSKYSKCLKITFKAPKSKFILPKISISQTKKLIKGMKASNSVGHDLASIKIYKKLVNRISPIIAHLINCIIVILNS